MFKPIFLFAFATTLLACDGTDTRTSNDSLTFEDDISYAPADSNRLTLQENETGTCDADGPVEDNHSGFAGDGFVNTENERGASITWKVSTSTSNNYQLSVRYANGGSSSRDATLTVNSNEGTTAVYNFPTTDGWGRWNSETQDIVLSGGTNTLLLEAQTGSGLPNIDSITISGESVAAADCSGSSDSEDPVDPVDPVDPSDPVDPDPVNPPSDVSPNRSMGGFANISGYGLSTTTGGSGGRTVTVSNYNDLKAAVQSSDILTIQVSGTIRASGDKMLNVSGSNKTIIGSGNGATFNGFGLNISSWTSNVQSSFGDSCDESEDGEVTPVSNVIVRNIRFTNSADDSITVQCWAHHVWVDHNTFETANDGSVDIKRGADLVTVSYNHFDNTGKTSIVGHSDNNGAQDRGHLRVTYHNNWFDRSNNRTPRVRFGYVHLYNNYYDNNDSVVRISSNGQIYAEANTVVDASKILRDTENEGSMTWTSSNVWDQGVFGGIGSKLLDADQSVSRPPYRDPVRSAPGSPPSAGVGRL